jgi:hypothetical protein
MTRIARKVEIPNEDRETLLKWKRNPTTPPKLVHRADIILAIAEGLNNKAVSESGVKLWLRYCRTRIWQRDFRFW